MDITTAAQLAPLGTDAVGRRVRFNDELPRLAGKYATIAAAFEGANGVWFNVELDEPVRSPLRGRTTFMGGVSPSELV